MAGRKRKISSLLHASMSRLAVKIAPLVREQLAAELEPELQRQFNDRMLPDLRERVRAILVEEIPATHAPAETPNETNGDDPLKERVLAIVDELFQAKLSASSLAHMQAYLPNAVVAGSFSGDYMVSSNAVAQDFLHPEFARFCTICHHPLSMHRKLWEWAYIYHRLGREGMLRPGLRGLVFGVGKERLPAVFANLGVHVTATDYSADDGWRLTDQYSENRDQLFYPELVDRQRFEELVLYETCDMNHIPDNLADFDFCWSSCSLEHLGSLQHGIDFIINSVERTVRVGGVACHTTELNLSSNEETIETGQSVLYRKPDLEMLCRILEERGHWVEPLHIVPGNLPPDYLVDVPPYRHNPHLKLLWGGFVTTSVGICVRRGG